MSHRVLNWKVFLTNKKPTSISIEYNGKKIERKGRTHKIFNNIHVYGLKSGGAGSKFTSKNLGLSEERLERIESEFKKVGKYKYMLIFPNKGETGEMYERAIKNVVFDNVDAIDRDTVLSPQELWITDHQNIELNHLIPNDNRVVGVLDENKLKKKLGVVDAEALNYIYYNEKETHNPTLINPDETERKIYKAKVKRSEQQEENFDPVDEDGNPLLKNKGPMRSRESPSSSGSAPQEEPILGSHSHPVTGLNRKRGREYEVNDRRSLKLREVDPVGLEDISVPQDRRIYDIGGFDDNGNRVSRKRQLTIGTKRELKGSFLPMAQKLMFHKNSTFDNYSKFLNKAKMGYSTSLYDLSDKYFKKHSNLSKFYIR